MADLTPTASSMYWQVRDKYMRSSIPCRVAGSRTLMMLGMNKNRFPPRAILPNYQLRCPLLGCFVRISLTSCAPSLPTSTSSTQHKLDGEVSGTQVVYFRRPGASDLFLPLISRWVCNSVSRWSRPQDIGKRPTPYLDSVELRTCPRHRSIQSRIVLDSTTMLAESYSTLSNIVRSC
jgi:hypothetical protein